ncbi:MAG: hypothetical protein HYV09_38160 [Deltaproteobacteria bacterium]|nr:hypothetical protein [Deltaproteobacteria bacterium]
MSKVDGCVPEGTKARDALAEARTALAEGRPGDAMLAIGRAYTEYLNTVDEAHAQFRAQLSQLARRAVRAAVPDGTHRILH